MNSKKHQKRCTRAKVEDALFKWFNECSKQNTIPNSEQIRKKAMDFAKELNGPFNPSRSWFCQWQKRFSVTIEGNYKTRGHFIPPDLDGYGAFQETISEVCVNTNMENIFNADEYVLLYNDFPIYYAAEKHSKLKDTLKLKMTLLFVCNATGSYKQIFAIGKEKAPQCANNKETPIRYFCNPKAEMTTYLFKHILSIINNEMIGRKQKITLFLDNANCHRSSSPCENIEVQFLPPNTTALNLPLNQGVIDAFKSKYLQYLENEQLSAIKRGVNLKEFTTISVFDALQCVKRAWDAVTIKTIKICFNKSGFSDRSLDVDSEEEEHTKALTNVFDYSLCDDGQTTDEILIDDIQTTNNGYNLCDYGQMTDEPIINIKCEEEEIQPPPPIKFVTEEEAFYALHQLQLYFNQNNIPSYQLKKVENQIQRHIKKNITQNSFMDYFE